jgi:RimK family alpha-L-glutamate ligase
MTKIAVFFGGKISQHLVLLRRAAKKLDVRLDLVSYNRVCFDTTDLKVKIRGNLVNGMEDKVKNNGWLQINDYDVLFFRTTGKHWEEVDLVVGQLPKEKRPIIVDPIVLNGKPSMACKAYQMLALKKAGIEVPKTVYGSLWYLYEMMCDSQHNFCSAHTNVATLRLRAEKLVASPFNFPVIIKGSGGDRGTRVFKVNNLVEMEKLVRNLRKSETEEGKRYMLQEYIPNDGDYRVLVLGKKVLGVMKRTRQLPGEFRNNFSVGGLVEVAQLPEEVEKLAVKAAEVCGLMVAGVDVAFRDNDLKKPVIWEVNKGPQFKGFMKATGIDVPSEMVKYLASLA